MISTLQATVPSQNKLALFIAQWSECVCEPWELKCLCNSMSNLYFCLPVVRSTSLSCFSVFNDSKEVTSWTGVLSHLETQIMLELVKHAVIDCTLSLLWYNINYAPHTLQQVYYMYNYIAMYIVYCRKLVNYNYAAREYMQQPIYIKWKSSLQLDIRPT